RRARATRGAGVRTADRAVQGDHVPGADVEGVPPVGAPGDIAEVPEVAGRTGRPVFVVPRHRIGDGQQAPEERVVVLDEVFVAAVLVLFVTEREEGIVAVSGDQVRDVVVLTEVDVVAR